jgi:hypothetical protein
MAMIFVLVPAVPGFESRNWILFACFMGINKRVLKFIENTLKFFKF